MKAINEWPLQKPTKYDLAIVEINYVSGIGIPDGYSEIFSEKIDGIWVNVVRYPHIFLPSQAKGELIIIFINGRKCEFVLPRLDSDKQYTAYQVISAIIWWR